jgi:hypothetical protein
MSGAPCFTLKSASPSSCSACPTRPVRATVLFVLCCSYTNDPEYKRATDDLAREKDNLAREKDNLLELRKEKNLLLSQGELLGPCCGTLAGCRSRGGPEGCTSSANSLSGREAAGKRIAGPRACMAYSS